MPTTFHKMHGTGNDFVLLDLRKQSLEVNPAWVVAVADRHTGVGCDQVLVLRRPADPSCLADFEVWNADGSPAEQCGNGARCIARYLDLLGETPRGRFCIGGPVRTMNLECLADGQVRVDMGAPDFDPARIPIAAQPIDGWYQINAGGGQYRIGAVSMGNPHALIRVDDIRDADVAELGPAISRHPCFPRGCNVGFAQVVDPGRIRLRVFERGAGETRACGSGACAAAAILQQAGCVGPKVLVDQEGGTLLIQRCSHHHPLMMTGPASHVFEGTLK